MEYLKLTWLYFRIGVLNEMQYRTNFFVQLMRALISLLTGLAVLALVFSYTDSLGGWSPAELLVVMGIHTMMGGVIRTSIQPNMIRFMEDVQQGTLDFVLTKPVDAQLIVSVREVRIWQVVDILIGLIVLAVALVLLQATVAPLQALAFLFVLLMGALMIYCFWLILTTCAFWVVRMHQIVELFQGLYQAGRWPVTIYPGWLRTMLTFLVPIAFAVTVPAEALTGRLTLETVLGTGLLAAVMFLFTRWFWNVGLRNYAGASA